MDYSSNKLAEHGVSDKTNPLDCLLGDYAVGRLSKPLHVLVQSHLELSHSSRRFVDTLEMAAANDVYTSPAKSVESEIRARRLKAVFDAKILDVHPNSIQSIHNLDNNDPLPFALRKYTGKSFKDIRWRWRMPGLKEYKIDNNDGYEASMLWIKAGRKMPSHTHDGAETTLVLKGSFGDVNEHFNRGDIAIADVDIDHSPRAGAGEDCICFVVTDAPLRLTGTIARFFHRFSRH